MKPIIILGAGMAGLIAANILRRHHPIIHETKSSLPNNHSALLRFRTLAVSDATGIPFKKVLVRKGIWTGQDVVDKCTLRLANTYSGNVVKGSIVARSIWNMEDEHRYIAPPNFVELMSEGAVIHYNFPHTEYLGDSHIITTAPLNASAVYFATKTQPRFEGKYLPIHTLKFFIREDVDVYQTIYNASSIATWWYRMSIHGNEVTVECRDKPCMDDDISRTLQGLLALIGIDVPLSNISAVRLGSQKFGKMLPIDEHDRCTCIAELTDRFGVYSLGRAGTWRPSLLLDDLVKDVKQIERMVNGGSYARKQVEGGAK